MKKLSIFILATMLAINVNAQSALYKKSDLKRMSKITLTEVYLNEVTKLFVNLPYTPFTLFGSNTADTNATTINSKLDVPVSDYFESKRNATIVGSATYSVLVRSELQEVIPYCDKKDIIASILYLQKVNLNVKSQKKANIIQKLIY